MQFHTLGPVQGNGLILFCVLNGKGASLLIVGDFTVCKGFDSATFLQVIPFLSSN